MQGKNHTPLTHHPLVKLPVIRTTDSRPVKRLCGERSLLWARTRIITTARITQALRTRILITEFLIRTLTATIRTVIQIIIPATDSIAAPEMVRLRL